MRAEGRTRTRDDFDEDDFAEPAFDRFERWLKREGLFVKCAHLATWHWWCDHHPKPRKGMPEAPTHPMLTSVALRNARTGQRVALVVKDLRQGLEFREGIIGLGSDHELRVEEGMNPVL